MKSLAILFLIVVLTTAESGYFFFGDYSISIGPFHCTLTGDKVYLRGLFYKDISSAERSQVAEYKKKMEEYYNSMQQYYNKPWYQRMNMTMAPYPKAPDFCGDNNTVIYTFDRCKVLGDQVFIYTRPARKLSSDEIKELSKFLEEAEKYAKHIEDQLYQEHSCSGATIRNLIGGKSDSVNGRQQQSQTSTPPPPQQPVPPEICTSYNINN